MMQDLATKGNRSCRVSRTFPALNPQTNGDRSDLACRILAVELVQLQAIVHKAVQNYTKMFRQLFCRLLFCERTTQVLAEKHSKYC